MAQARITDSAIKKAKAAEPDEIVKFALRLSEVILGDDELVALQQMGMVEFMRTIHVAMVEVPVRELLSVAELPSVVRVS